MKSDFSVQINVVNVCCSYLSMVFPYRVSQKFVPLLYKSVFQYDWTWEANH